MKQIPPDNDSSAAYEITEQKGSLILCFKGRMDIHSAAPLMKDIFAVLTAKKPSAVSADLAGVSYFDDFGALVLFEIREFMTERQGKFGLLNVSPGMRDILEQIRFDTCIRCVPVKKKRSVNMVMRMGQAAIGEASDLGFMLTFIGSVISSLFHVLCNPKSLRAEDTITQMEKTGVDALPIVALISFLLGLIMAFMSSIQFRQFGASIYVASLVAFAMVSELGPIMTAIVVAGRSGSAFAAEIGTMKISEEIDALSTMGFDPILFLAIPRLIAAVVMVPLLALFSNLFAISGGMMVGVFMLNLTPNTYIKQTLVALTLKEVIWGMGKSGVFAGLIAGIGCMRGFQAKGGASAVGNAATSAVVSSIFLIILFDSIFAVIRSYIR